MKQKKRWLSLGLAACLTALVIALGLHLAFDRVHLHQIDRTYANSPPAQIAAVFPYATVGAYPGLSDEPVSWEDGQRGRDFYALLEQYTYASVPLPRPRPGGLAVSTARGCSPEYVAYWDGLFLWFPTIRREKLVWQAYLPSSPWDFSKGIHTLCNKYDINY